MWQADEPKTDSKSIHQLIINRQLIYADLFSCHLIMNLYQMDGHRPSRRSSLGTEAEFSLTRWRGVTVRTEDHCWAKKKRETSAVVGCPWPIFPPWHGFAGFAIFVPHCSCDFGPVSIHFPHDMPSPVDTGRPPCCRRWSETWNLGEKSSDWTGEKETKPNNIYTKQLNRVSLFFLSFAIYQIKSSLQSSLALGREMGSLQLVSAETRLDSEFFVSPCHPTGLQEGLVFVFFT